MGKTPETPGQSEKNHPWEGWTPPKKRSPLSKEELDYIVSHPDASRHQLQKTLQRGGGGIDRARKSLSAAPTFPETGMPSSDLPDFFDLDPNQDSPVQSLLKRLTPHIVGAMRYPDIQQRDGSFVPPELDRTQGIQRSPMILLDEWEGLNGSQRSDLGIALDGIMAGRQAIVGRTRKATLGLREATQEERISRLLGRLESEFETCRQQEPMEGVRPAVKLHFYTRAVDNRLALRISAAAE